MTQTRAFILLMAAVLAVEAGIFYSLVGLGADGELIVAIEMIWLCVSVVLAASVVGHFER
jgi:hypothetical protein